jgi:chemotaxis protein MotB
MAGLLFVFILLIGAIVSKSILMREDLHKKEDRLTVAEQTLEEKRRKLNLTQKQLTKLTRELHQRETILQQTSQTLLQKKLVVKKQKHLIADINTSLSKKEQALKKKEKKIADISTTLTQKVQTVKKQKDMIADINTSLTQKVQTVKKQKKTISQQEEKIRLQSQEVEKLHTLLRGLKADLLKAQQQGEASQRANVDLNKTIVLTHNALKLKEQELERLNQLLLARNAKVDTLSKKIIILQNLTDMSDTTIQEKQKKLQEYIGKVVVLSNQLTEKESELNLKDQKLANLLTALDDKKTRYDDLLQKLQKQRTQIKSLTGIQLKVIAALKETLGNKIDIDRRNGALRLASNILFDKGKSNLKESAKTELANAFNDYIGALVTNEAIRPHLERIVIEGHTDSDGTYMYNLELSQKRALAVMNHLLTLPIAQKYNLKKYLAASGRAYLDPIRHNGKEDKEASRRIEIKFQLKNRDAMHEIERILDAQ